MVKRKSRWSKHLSEKKARKLSKAICDHFDIPYCGIHYVKELDGYDDETSGVYYDNNPPLILVKRNCICQIGIVIHELCHHLEAKLYDSILGDSEHGKNYQKAKEKMVSWCRANISDKCNWYLVLKAKYNNHQMRNFHL